MPLKPIEYIDRSTGDLCVEKVYGERVLKLLYGDSNWGRILAAPMRSILGRVPWVSAFYGWMQKQGYSRGKIRPFIAEFGIDPDEFELSIEQFSSFNDFFVRKLKPEARPVDADPEGLVLPADGRYRVYERVDLATDIAVKGGHFRLDCLLNDREMARRYEGGSLVMVRLAPPDYHRFHFPASGVATVARPIRGWLYSVNPWAVQRFPQILWQNKRQVTQLSTELFGEIAMVAIGATCVGTIVETYEAGPVVKGQEKGYFEFGGSAMVLLFEPGRVQLAGDLLANSARGLETLGHMGQLLGRRRG